MSSFDLLYANKCIDSILEKTKKMTELYRDRESAAFGNDRLLLLRELYILVSKEVSSYQDYLGQSGVPANESFLTKWLENSEYREIEDFVDSLF